MEKLKFMYGKHPVVKQRTNTNEPALMLTTLEEDKELIERALNTSSNVTEQRSTESESNSPALKSYRFAIKAYIKRYEILFST